MAAGARWRIDHARIDRFRTLGPGPDQGDRGARSQVRQRDADGVEDPDQIDVVDESRIPGYRVAGKTGTAQRFDPACGCYRGNTLSFIGMAPADQPKIVVAVTLQAPKLAIGGGVQGGPVFQQVASFALDTLRIPPTPYRKPVFKINAH